MSEYKDIRQELIHAASLCNERFRVGSESERKKREYETTLVSVERRIRELTETANHLNDIYKNVKSYAINHSDAVYELLNTAMIEAGALVPDASVDGIHLHKSENNRVSVLNGKGQDVNLREGGGLRVILGTLLRYACLKAQPSALQLILFDESFFTLSDITTSLMKDVLSRMAEDTVIICIEQRRNVVDGITAHTYEFKKGADGITRVTHVDEDRKVD